MKNKTLMAFTALTSITQAADLGEVFDAESTNLTQAPGLHEIFDFETQLKPTYKDTGPTGTAIMLAPEIEQRLIKPENIEKILDLHYTYHFSTEDYDYLYFGVSLLGDFKFEGIWHGAKLARKESNEESWKNCELFSPVSSYPIDLLNKLQDREIMGITNEHHVKKYVDLSNQLNKLKTTKEQLDALNESRAQPVVL